MTATKQNIIHVGIDGGDFAPDNEVKSGIQRLVKSCLTSIATLKNTDKKWFYYFFVNKQNRDFSESFIYRNLPTRFFSSLFLPFRMVLDRVHIYLGFSGILPHLIRVFGRKSIIFIHDFGFYTHPQYYRDPEKMVWQTEYAIYGADRIIVFSDYIEDQIFARFPRIPKNKVIRIYPGADHIVKYQSFPKMDVKFFLFVGVIKAVKNIELLLQYFSQFLSQSEEKNIKLILIGSKEEKYYQKICRSLIFKKINSNLVFLEKVSDKELVNYYFNCYALLNVSHEEGFCYPVIEALHLGRTVIVNDIPLYREFKPYFPSLYIEKNKESFINAMHKTIKEQGSPRGKVKSPFVWRKFVIALLQVINNITS